MLELVIDGLKPGGISTNEDTSVSLVRWLFVANHVLAENQVVMVSTNDDRGLPFLNSGSVVQNNVTLETVAMCTGFSAFISKLDALFGVGDDSIAGKRVVSAVATD